MDILTHRGLEPTQKDFFSESSFEAFESQVKRGFGIEFDPCFLGDDAIGVIHAPTHPPVELLNAQQFLQQKLPNGRLCLLPELLDLLQSNAVPLSALHLKGKYQDEESIVRLLQLLEKYPSLLEHVILFDLLPETARFIKAKNQMLLLACSVAHPYDVQRYNSAVHGTLLTVEEAKKHRSLYDWVWLDEWDLTDQNGKQKTLNNPDTFASLREVDYKIALITPELHGTSPGLLGGESHPDAESYERLIERIEDILELRPDAVCTDYPEEVRQLTGKR